MTETTETGTEVVVTYENKYGTQVTAKGRIAIADAMAKDAKLNATHVAFGDGNGSEYFPTEDMTDIRNQVHLAEVASIGIDPANPHCLAVDVYLEADVGGWEIREAALRSSDGETIAIVSLPTHPKHALKNVPFRTKYRLLFAVVSTSAFELKIDPNADAIREIVDLMIQEHTNDPGAHGGAIAKANTFFTFEMKQTEAGTVLKVDDLPESPAPLLMLNGIATMDFDRYAKLFLNTTPVELLSPMMRPITKNAWAAGAGVFLQYKPAVKQLFCPASGATDSNGGDDGGDDGGDTEETPKWDEYTDYDSPDKVNVEDMDYEAVLPSGPGTAVGPRNPASEPVCTDVTIHSNYSTLKTLGAVHRAAYGDGRVIAVLGGTESKAQYSVDGGATWISISTPSEATWASITYGEGRFVIVRNNSNQAAYSTDGGVTWKTVSLPSSAEWFSVTYGNGRFVAVARDSNKAAYSIDGGAIWIAATMPISSDWYSICYGGGRFVAVAYSDVAAYSLDGGATWVAAALPSSDTWASVTYGRNRFVAIGGSSAAYSTDGGETWNATTLPTSTDWYSVCYGDGLFVATQSKSHNIACSADGGETWTLVSIPPPSNGSGSGWSDIIYCNDEKFVVVAYNGNSAGYFTTDVSYLSNCWKKVE